MSDIVLSITKKKYRYEDVFEYMRLKYIETGYIEKISDVKLFYLKRDDISLSNRDYYKAREKLINTYSELGGGGKHFKGESEAERIGRVVVGALSGDFHENKKLEIELLQKLVIAENEKEQIQQDIQEIRSLVNALLKYSSQLGDKQMEFIGATSEIKKKLTSILKT